MGIILKNDQNTENGSVLLKLNFNNKNKSYLIKQ